MEKLILAIKNIYVPIYQAIYPWLSRKKATKKNNIINKISPVIFIVSTVVTLLILLFAKTILNSIYSNAIISSYVDVFRILSFISIFSGLNMLYNMLYFPSKGHYTLRMKILISGAIFNISMNLIIVNFYGIYGVAVVVASTELLLFILGYYNFRKSICNT
jgi:PST family polysaccharide transporter